VFFPEGVRFDGTKLVGTGATLPVFNYLNPVSDEKKELVDLTGARWNRMRTWLHSIDSLRATS
jgi:hypothetical protein